MSYLGTSQIGGKLNLVFEHTQGNLRDHLRSYKANPSQFKNNQLSEKKLTNFALQIAKGLKYLASKNLYHPDVALSNVFLHNDDVKIGNYGYPADSFDVNYYLEEKRYLWLAPESSSEKKFDKQTNV